MMRLKMIFAQILLCLLSLMSWAQDFDGKTNLLSSGNILKDKLFYVFTAMEYMELDKALQISPYVDVHKDKIDALEGIALGNHTMQNLERLKFKEDEIEAIKKATGDLRHDNQKWDELVTTYLLPSGYYFDSGDFILSSALDIALRGVNRIIDTYGLGVHGKFAYIDSVSFNVKSREYAELLTVQAKSIIEHFSDKKVFYQPSLAMALSLLQLNERTDAARFEPMENGVNMAAVKAVSRINWSKYPYSVILVPGNGPKGTESLSNNAKARLNSAVANYNRRMAPFIMVSGGNVHPYKTKINEAEEMKKELILKYGIPESAIIMEPHARHTTTNLRNCNRLVLRYGFPRGKRVLITTDKKQADKISKVDFVERSKKELGHVPFVKMDRISDIDIAYYPVLQSLKIDLMDPLDP